MLFASIDNPFSQSIITLGVAKCWLSFYQYSLPYSFLLKRMNFPFFFPLFEYHCGLTFLFIHHFIINYQHYIMKFFKHTEKLSFIVNTSPTIYILLQFITYFFIYAVLYPSVILPYFLTWLSYRLYSYFLLFGIQFVRDSVSDLRMLFTNDWIYLLYIITLDRILCKHSEYIKMRSQ